MAEPTFMLAPQPDASFYEERARAEREAAAAPSSPALASAHRLLAIAYEGEARDLREGRGHRR